MKKKLFLLLMTMLPMVASADYYDVQINGIYYKLNNDSKEATVVMGCTESITDSYGYNYGPASVVSYAGDVVIPESFTYNGVTYTVTSIEGQVRGLDVFISYGAFEECKDLTSITIPKTIKAIGHQAFAGCTSLQSVYISDLAAWCNISFNLYNRYGDYFSNANPLFFAHDLYLNGNKISNLAIPKEVTTIKEGAFIGSSITSVVFHKNVSDIGCMAFDGCNGLTDVYSYSPSLTSNGSFIDHTNKKLHIRERYYDSYFPDDPYYGDGSSEWKLFGKVEYIEGVDYNLVYIVDDVEYKKIIMEVGEAITPEPEPTKEGYTFSGWSEIPETMPAHDIVVTGTFERYFDVGNLTKAIDFIMKSTASADDIALYDLNNNKKLDIGDVVLIVKFILNNNNNAPSFVGRRAGEVAELTQYTAAQFEVKTTSNVNVENIRLVKSMEQTHQLMCQQKDANTYAVVVYSLSNQLMQTENGKIIEIGNNSDILSIENVTVATPTGETAYYQTLSATTGIEQTERGNGTAVIYDLKGNRLNGSKALEKGFYIVNGKKTVVR